MTLSDEDKRRIEEEERYRDAVREKIEREKNFPKIIATVIIVGVLLAGPVWCIQKFNEPETPGQATDRKTRQEARTCKDPIGAFVMTQQYVEQRLKAPATAEFPSYTEIRVKYLGDCTHLVTAWVDAHNAFGALIRKPYSARIKHTGEYKYRLIDLKM